MHNCEECSLIFESVQDLNDHRTSHKEFYVGQDQTLDDESWDMEPATKRVKLTGDSWSEILPGDTFDHQTSYQSRILSSPLDRVDDVKVELDTGLSDIDIVDLHNEDGAVKAEGTSEDGISQLEKYYIKKKKAASDGLADIRRLFDSIISPLAKILIDSWTANMESIAKSVTLQQGIGQQGYRKYRNRESSRNG